MTPKFIEDSLLIQFDEPTHKYTLNGQECISVTTFIDKFKIPFDESGALLTKCALKEGVSESVLKKRWNDKGTKAGIIGNKIHESIEYYINTGKIRKNKYSLLVEEFSKLKFKGKLFSEVILFDESLLISGTSDLVQIIDNKIVQVHDIKSNEKCPTDYSYGQYMKYPISHLPAGKLILYELQISLYLYLLSSKYGYEIGPNNFIFWTNRKKNIIKQIPVTLRINEITDMIAYYTYMKSLTPEELLELDKPKIIPAQTEETWID